MPRRTKPVPPPPPTEKRPDYIKSKEEVVSDAKDVVSAEQLAGIAAMATELRGLKDTKDAHEDALKTCNKAIDELSIKLATIMDAAKVDGLRVDGIGLLYISDKIHASPSNAEAFIEWLDSRGLGGMAKRYVHPSTMKAWVKDWVKEGNPLPDTLNYFVQRVAIIRRS